MSEDEWPRRRKTPAELGGFAHDPTRWIVAVLCALLSHSPPGGSRASSDRTVDDARAD